MIKILTILLPLLAASPVVAYYDCRNGSLSNNTVCDVTASLTARAQALMRVLTIDEKFNLTGNTSPGVPRLGLPFYQWWNEALHGVANSPGVSFNNTPGSEYNVATSFPQPILIGAAFDDQLVHDIATVVSTEARAFANGNHAGLDFWTPNINPYKDPRWGRGMETPGEDTFHLKSYVKALIDGLQGGQDQDVLKVVATCKHFTAYDLESWGGNLRTEFDATVSQQDLSEYYMQPFQACARDARVASVMCSYNALNGVPTCADPFILEDILRDHWNWTSDWNYVVSDCDAIQAVGIPHDYSSSPPKTVADTLTSGTDLNCGTYYQTHLPEAYAAGLITETDIDKSLLRLYSALIKVGYFDETDPYRNLSYAADVNTPDSQALALRAAEEGVVLLKNNGILPFHAPQGSATTVALIGNWVNTTNSTLMQGNYYGNPPYTNGIDTAAQNLLPNTNVVIAEGGVGGLTDPTTDSWPYALSAAREADLIIYAAGSTPSDAEEGNDRNKINWSGEFVDLISEVASIGKPVILVAMGDQLDSAPFLSNPNISAIIWGGYPGQDGGTAIMNVIKGAVAPAGRLPVTQYPADYVNQVAMTDMSLRPNDSTGNPGRTYMWYDNATLPFGHGLHYTNFTTSITSNDTTSYQISDLMSTCNGSTTGSNIGASPFLDLCPFQTFPVTVQNTGDVASDFVTLGFIAGSHGPEPYPIKTLAAYQRLFNITAGSAQTAYLNLTLGSLARFDEDGNQVLYPGEYSLLVDVPTQSTFNFSLTGDQVTLDHWPQRSQGAGLGQKRQPKIRSRVGGKAMT